MVCTERAETAAASRGTSHVSAVLTLLPWIVKKHAVKKLVTQNCMRPAVSLLESGEQRYIKAVIINNNSFTVMHIDTTKRKQLNQSAGGLLHGPE